MFKTILFKLKSLIQNLKWNFSTAHDDLGPHFMSSPFSFLLISTEASPFPIRPKIPLRPVYFFYFFFILEFSLPARVIRPFGPPWPTRGLLPPSDARAADTRSTGRRRCALHPSGAPQEAKSLHRPSPFPHQANSPSNPLLLLLTHSKTDGD
jgi:hypothetical protein